MNTELGLARALVPEASSVRVSWAVFAALVGHAALLALALAQEPSAPPLVAVTEVELLRAREPTPVPALQERKPEPPSVAPKSVFARRPAASKPRNVSAPEPAGAAPLRTAVETAPSPEEPVRFVTDPNGAAFGYGTVARGGAGTSGLPPPVVPVALGSGAEQPAPLLSRSPSLGERDPCRGFFPQRAQVDRGEVALKVRVEADGSVRSVAIAREAPAGQGFGFAARDCLLSKRFSPALDVAGQPVAVLSPVTVKFSR